MLTPSKHFGSGEIPGLLCVPWSHEPKIEKQRGREQQATLFGKQFCTWQARMGLPVHSSEMETETWSLRGIKLPEKC